MSDPFAHPSSCVDEGAEIGPRTRVWHFTHVMTGARIGSDCTLGQNVFVASGVSIGDGVKIQNNVSVYEGVTLEDGVFCGPSVVFTNVATPRSHVSRRDQFEQTLVKKGATLGANCTVVCGVTVGEYALVGAGAVVARDVAPYSVVVGVPARPAGWACACGHRIVFRNATAVCGLCGARYRQTSDNRCEPCPPSQ